jgi:hypothetical protein
MHQLYSNAVLNTAAVAAKIAKNASSINRIYYSLVNSNLSINLEVILANS